MFRRDLGTLSAASIIEAFANEPSQSSVIVALPRTVLFQENLATVVHQVGLTKSRNEGRKAIVEGGSVSINAKRVQCSDPRNLPKLQPADLIDGRVVVLGLGLTRRIVTIQDVQ